MATVEESQFKLRDGLEVYTKTWKPAGPPIAQVFFLHGFSDHCNAYYEFPTVLADAGIELFSFDQRGWGRTAADRAQWGVSGATSQLFADIDELLLRRLEAHPGIPLFLAGHSMGGGVALTYAYSGPRRDKVAGVAVWSPMIDIAPETRPLPLVVAAGRLAAKLFPARKLVNKLEPSFMSRDPDVCKAFSEDPLCHDTGTLIGIAEMLDRARKLREPEVLSRFPESLPILVMHGTADKVTDFSASREFVAGLKVKDKTFKQYDGWFHKLHAEPGEGKTRIGNDVVEWVRARCSGGSPNSKL